MARFFVVLVLSMLLAVVTAQTNTTAAPSFCELCRDNGQCSQAYKASPGIYCGPWLNAANQRLACCCPADGLCAKADSNYKCLCSVKPKAKSSAGRPTDKPPSFSLVTAAVSAVAVGVVVLA